MTTGETDAVLTGTWKMQVDLAPNLLDALNDALGLDLQMDDPTVMTMLVTFEEDGLSLIHICAAHKADDVPRLHPLPDGKSLGIGRCLLYTSNKLYLTPPQDEESGDWGGMFGSEYPMVFERVD